MVDPEDAFYHACEQADVAQLEALYRPGFEEMINHKLDFEDAAGVRWFLDRGADVNAQGSLHWAIGRGRGVAILELLLDAGADVDLEHPYASVRPLEAAARSAHLAAFDLLVSRGATAELTETAAATLAVARGQSTQLPGGPAPMPGVAGDGPSWVLGQLALLGRTAIVRALLDAGADVDARGWSNFTPLDQAAMHGRADTVRLLVQRGADVADCAFDEHGVTPLDCAIWGVSNNPAPDGDYPETVRILTGAGAPTTHTPPTGHDWLDDVLDKARPAR